MLSGEVGIFPPRLDEIVHRESKMFEKIKNALGYPPSQPIEHMDAETLYVAADFSKLDTEDREFLSFIRKIENDYIRFKHSYLLKKLGNLPDRVLEAKELFNHVRSCVDKDRSAQVRESQRENQRRDVWRSGVDQP